MSNAKRSGAKHPPDGIGGMIKCTIIFTIGALFGAACFAGGAWYQKHRNHQLSKVEYTQIEPATCYWRGVYVKCEQFMRK